MTCEHVKLADGTTAIVCTLGKRKAKPCSVCGKPSTKLCDWVTAQARDFGEQDHTCDKPLCDACAVHSGKNTDFCPDHPRIGPRQAELAL